MSDEVGNKIIDWVNNYTILFVVFWWSVVTLLCYTVAGAVDWIDKKMKSRKK